MNFLRNAWYVAAWSGELSVEAPMRRVLLGEPVALFRDNDGRPVALADQCPHRFAPLSRGRVRDGAIECPYHGLAFDGTGRCVHNPHGDGRIPEAARVTSYPLMERYGAVWIWMGEPQHAADTPLPDFGYLDPTENETSVGYLLTRAHYQLSVDNLLDLSHFQFLHPDTLGTPSITAGSMNFDDDGETVWARRATHGEHLRDAVALPFGVPKGVPVDRWMDVRWNAPALMSIEVGATISGLPREFGLTSFSGHFLTPETEASTHYFFGFGLPKALGARAREVVEYAVEMLMGPFRDEDLPMLEAQQQALGEREFWSARPLVLPIDGGAVRARRIMERKLEAERALGAENACRESAGTEAGSPETADRGCRGEDGPGNTCAGHRREVRLVQVR